MYCPQCRLEYREGFTECADCGVPLLAGSPPPDPPSDFNPSLDLVEVLETEDSVQLAMAKGLLEDAGIPFYLRGQIARLVNDVDPFLQKHVRVQVPRDREQEARELLEMLLEPDPNALVAEDDAFGAPGGDAR
jgi:Putative prokaryotic signal transducing protein